MSSKSLGSVNNPLGHAPTLTMAGDGDVFTPEQRALGGRNSAAARKGRAAALSILEDPEYLENLRLRAKTGELAPAVEVHLMRLGWGEPPKDDTENEELRLRFAETRRMMRELMEGDPGRRAVLEATVTRAPRLLPVPTLRAQPPVEDGERETGSG